MRTLQITLQILGMLILLLFITNMFLFFVMDDMLWFSWLFLGIMVFMMGCLVEVWREKPISPELIRRKRVRANSCWSAIGLCGVVLMFILEELINRI